jgi:hypothetical protein
MQFLNVEEMESSYKIDLRDMSWWMSNKETHKPRVPVTAKLSKERWISLVIRGSPSHVTPRHD